MSKELIKNIVKGQAVGLKDLVAYEPGQVTSLTLAQLDGRRRDQAARGAGKRSKGKDAEAA